MNDKIDENKNVLVRNIAQISCVSKDKGVLSAVRGLLSHEGKLYFERKDSKEGEYVYFRLQSNSNYDLRPFEFKDVTSANLNIRCRRHEERCIHLFNIYSLEVCDRMYHRLSKQNDKIRIPTDSVVDYISIDYYNPKRIPVDEQYWYVHD